VGAGLPANAAAEHAMFAGKPAPTKWGQHGARQSLARALLC